MIIICETLWVMRMTCRSGSSPAGCISIRVVATLSDMSHRLPLLSSHSMSDHDDYYITFPVTLAWVDVLLVYACYSLYVQT
jgi:hypothetical protein